MNERDSEAVAAQLVAKGYTLAPAEQSADVILLNTCSVRDAAEQKAIGKMQNLVAEVRKHRPEVVLGFLGCMAQSRGQSLIDRLPDVDLVIGTQKFHRTAEHLNAIFSGQLEKICDIDPEPGSEETIKEHLFAGTSREKAPTAFVSIMQGCNQRCTFCIVPDTRGPERSRTISEIVRECEDLVAHGVKEVTLLGQIVTSYGRREIGTKNGTSAFVQLLEAVEAVEGLERIRFTSPHPKGYGDDLVGAYGRLSKLCESAHLPAQSGSNDVLKRMHRGYTRERFLELVKKLRQVKPAMGITTDFIVGFPGESESEFADTLSLVQEAEFDNAFVFKYSPRRDTPAATMVNQIPEPVKEERHRMLLDEVNKVGATKYQECVGEKVQILVEGLSKKSEERMMGRTRSNKIVLFPGNERHHGNLLDVRIVRNGNFTLYGDPAVLNLD